jgi:hypothetical protein
MVRFASLALLSLALFAQAASAQHVIVYSPPPAVVTYSPPPVTVYAPPVVEYAPPIVTVPAYRYSYYAPAPVTTVYSVPATTVYSVPATTVYSAPSVYVPGTVTTRSYVGLGIFRPRGVYTESYFTPLR